MARRHSASVEDYLETIMLLAEEEEGVTVTRISEEMGVTKPSVTSAIRRLVKNELATHEKYGEIHLTNKGLRVARDVYKRHQILTHFMMDVLDIKEDIASEDACRAEHCLSPVSVERLNQFMEYVESCPQGRPCWLEGFNYYLNHGKRNPEQVNSCVAGCKKIKDSKIKDSKILE